MAGLPWLQLEVAFTRHPKTIALGEIVGADCAIATMIRLWSWLSEFAPIGVVRGERAAEQIEAAAGWQGDPGALVSALVGVRLLDAIRGGFRAHNWEKRQGAHIEHRSRERARWRNHKTMSRGSPRGVPGKMRGEERRGEDLLLSPAAPGPIAKPKPGPAKKPTDPRHRPTVELLTRVFAELRRSPYAFSGRDARAVATVLAFPGSTPPEIERRWRAALEHPDKFRRVDAIHEFAAKWNAYAGTEASVRLQVAAPPSHHSRFEETPL